MLQTLLFFHILAVTGLFAGMAMELSALMRLHRAQTVADVRAAVLNVPAIGPMMGASSVLLIAMGIALTYAGGFGWSAGWLNAVFGLTIVLAVLGPAVTGRKAEALHALAQEAGEGAVTPAIDAARRDRVFNYMVFMSLFELVAALYIMVTKPGMSAAGGLILAAALLALLPAARVLRAKDPAVAAESA